MADSYTRVAKPSDSTYTLVPKPSQQGYRWSDLAAITWAQAGVLGLRWNSTFDGYIKVSKPAT